MSKYLQFFRLSCNIQTLFYWGRKGELYTNYHIRLISYYKDLKTKVVPWFSLVIGQNANHQLATSSEKLVARVQFLVASATSESQFRALDRTNHETTAPPTKLAKHKPIMTKQSKQGPLTRITNYHYNNHCKGRSAS